ncbi:sensor protein [Enterovibrio norvegicus]|uniref:sensor protein n=1 Tax=Enterovibrio norvegicus TaxID=188144 RepID=UPI000C82A2B3|nr:sensor protein [Enterovibrio norvegicus]PML79989.1 sensor protein [Enterovibrio norvegicus]
MRKFIIFLAVFLTGCSAQQIQYSSIDMASKELAASVIEQVVMEQPTKFRPEGIIVSTSYIGLSEGHNAKGVAVSNHNDITNLVVASANIKLSDINSRYYFNSISKLELYSKRDWFIVQLLNEEKRVVKRFYTRNLEKGKRLIDSIHFMKISAKPFGVE